MTYLQSLEIYDPVSGGTTLLAAKMQRGRCGHTAHLLQDGRVMIVAGYCGNSKCPQVAMDDIYDPATDKVTPLAHGADYTYLNAAATLLDGRVLVIGAPRTSIRSRS